MNDEILIKVALDATKLESGFRDHSKLWDLHNAEVEKGKKTQEEYVNNTIKSRTNLNKALKTNIDKVAAEGKAVQALEKKFESFNKKNEKSFNTQKIETFNKSLEGVSKNIANLEQFNISTEDMDYLTSKLSVAQDDFEALNILVDFFESKMKDSATTVADSFDVIKKKIDETKLNISSTEGFIKEISKDISSTAPGQDQANLIAERTAATKALNEEKIALADYQIQLKKAREENVSMASQLRKVKDELVQLELAGERGGDRWIELSEQAQKYNEVIVNTNAELRRTSSSTEGLDNLIGAAAGIVGVFSAAEGAASLFGNESEDLQKTLVRLNGAIALLNGLQAIQTELAKKETIAARALTFVQGQYAIATDASAKATLRLSAASKLLGIGLLIATLAAIVVYWKDISKWIGITTEKTEALNTVNKQAINNSTAEIGRLKSLQLELENTNTPLDRQREIKKELLDQYPTYLKALGDEKSSAEDITTAFDNLNKALILNAKLSAARELIGEEFKKVLEAERKAALGEVSTYQTIANGIKNAFSNPALAGINTVSDNFTDAQKNLSEAKKDFEDFEDFITKFIGDTNFELNKLGGDPTKDGELFKDAIKEYEKFSSLLANLVDEQEDYRIEAIENGREKEKEILKAKLNDEKENYQQQIDDLKVSEERKAKLREEFNKLYNEQTGVAYEQLRKDILKIDEKYDNDLLAVKLKAQSAIDAVFKSETELERKAIEDRFDAIRQELLEQLEQTEDLTEKNEIKVKITTLNTAENAELSNFDLNTDLDRVDREMEIAETVLSIHQNNASDLILNEELKQLQILKVQEDGLKKRLALLSGSLNESQLEELNKFQEAIDNASSDIEAKELGDALAKSLGDETAIEILKVADALKKVGNEINKIGSQSGLGNTINEIAEWTSSLEGFGLKLAESLGLQGEAAKEFAEFTANAINSVVDGLNALFDAEIEQRQAKIDSIQESIDAVEEEVEREQQLYEDGYANNYEARQEDLNSLKQQKKKEEEELKKAQKQKALIQKAEMIANLASQASNLITSVTEITKAHSGIPFVGVALAIGFIATMFGAIAQAKAQAQSITGGQNFRRGLQEGPLSLSGPRHEERGFGLYNSKTGERVAEFEDGEKLYTVNKRQQHKYTDVLDAMVADSKGTGNLETFLKQKYSVDPLGNETIQIVKHVNEITVKSQKTKEDASGTDEKLLNEIEKLRSDFAEEFKGHRKKEEDKTESWETKEYYHVKKGNKTKKYRKD